MNQIIEVGDIVKINKNITLGDLINNLRNKCQMETMRFLSNVACTTNFDKEYKVTYVDDNCIVVEGYKLAINKTVFYLERKNIEEKGELI